jgi:flagellar protein FlbD
MIKVTRINKVDKFWINEDLIEFIEETPDTMLTMVSGKKHAVAESAEEISEMIRQLRYPYFVTRDENEEPVLQQYNSR